MRQQFNCKIILVTVAIVLFISKSILAQVPPAGKYNTTNYPEDRKAIEALGIVKDSRFYIIIIK